MNEKSFRADVKGEKRNRLSGWLLFITALALGAFFSYFDSTFVAKEISPLSIDLMSEHHNPLLKGVPALLKKEKFTHSGKEVRVVWSEERDTVIPFHINSVQAFRLRIKGYFPRVSYGKSKAEVLVNGTALGAFEPRWEGEFEKISLNIPASYMKSADNSITIRTLGPNSYTVGYETLNIRNYTGNNRNFPRAYVLFDENYPALGLSPMARPYNYILYPAFVFVMWVVSGNLLRTAEGKGLEASLKKALLWYGPSVVIMLASTAFTGLTGLTLIYHPEGLYLLLFAPTALLSAYSLTLLALRRLKNPPEKRTAGERPARRTGILESEAVVNGYRSARRAAALAIRFASTSAILAFSVSLIAAGALLIARKQGPAERMADIAYFLLVFGVILRVFDVKRE